MGFTNLIETDVAEIYRAVLTGADEAAFVVVPSTNSVERLVAVLDDLDNPPTVRLLALEDTFKEVLGDFLVASTVADLVADGSLSLRTTDGDGMAPLVVHDGAVVSVVGTGTHVAGLGTDDDAFVESATEQYTAAWEEAPEYSLRTPPLSRIRETMEAEFGPGVRTDFDSVLASLNTARGDDGFDEVTVSLLVAAKNEVLLYDISKWGEDTGVASKATFSRTKTRLEEMGLIDTKKVPIDVGRPRLRLLLGDERLADVDADDLAAVAKSLLSTGAS